MEPTKLGESIRGHVHLHGGGESILENFLLRMFFFKRRVFAKFASFFCPLVEILCTWIQPFRACLVRRNQWKEGEW